MPCRLSASIQSWIGTRPIPQPHQNWSQHARLLPYLEQQVLYQFDQLVLRRSLEDGDTVYDRTRPTTRPAAADSIPQMTVLVATICGFLCPSDPNPGSSGTFTFGGVNKRVGASNYACNIGLNRGGPTAGS